MESYQIHLSEAELPQAWYNLIDLAAYDAFLEGKLQEVDTDPGELIRQSLAHLPKLPGK